MWLLCSSRWPSLLLPDIVLQGRVLLQSMSLPSEVLHRSSLLLFLAPQVW